MNQIKIKAEPRTEQGTGAVRRLRRTGMIPGSVMKMKKGGTELIKLPEHDFMMAMRGRTGACKIQAVNTYIKQRASAVFGPENVVSHFVLVHSVAEFAFDTHYLTEFTTFDYFKHFQRTGHKPCPHCFHKQNVVFPCAAEHFFCLFGVYGHRLFADYVFAVIHHQARTAYVPRVGYGNVSRINSV